ncbi:MAG: hypothetical protein ABH850_00940 [Candidatus Micrarchaeota archaeon]
MNNDKVELKIFDKFEDLPVPVKNTVLKLDTFFAGRINAAGKAGRNNPVRVPSIIGTMINTELTGFITYDVTNSGCYLNSVFSFGTFGTASVVALLDNLNKKGFGSFHYDVVNPEGRKILRELHEKCFIRLSEGSKPEGGARMGKHMGKPNGFTLESGVLDHFRPKQSQPTPTRAERRRLENGPSKKAMKKAALTTRRRML